MEEPSKVSFISLDLAFKEKLFEAVNTLLQGIAQKEDEKYFSIANNNKLISKLVESKLLEEAK